MSKLPSQLTDEEILALLNSDEVEESSVQIFDYKDDIVPFLSFYNITPGDSPVSKKLLYKLYKAYSKEPLDQLNFNVQVGRFVSPSRDHFNLNLDNFAISNHIYQAEKKRDKTKSLTFQKHFNWFITERGVESGSHWIEGFILFFIYKDFCKSRRVNPRFGYVNFHKFLKLHFQYKRINGNRSLWFKVNQEIAQFYTEEEKDVIRNARTKEKRRNEEEGKPGAETSKTE